MGPLKGEIDNTTTTISKGQSSEKKYVEMVHGFHDPGGFFYKSSIATLDGSSKKIDLDFLKKKMSHDEFCTVSLFGFNRSLNPPKCIIDTSK